MIEGRLDENTLGQRIGIDLDFLLGYLMYSEITLNDHMTFHPRKINDFK